MKTEDTTKEPGIMEMLTQPGFDYERLLDCIHCGLCLSSCPSYAVLGTEMDSPRGRIFMMRALSDGRMEINRTVKKHIDLCLACRGCETACPSGVVYHPLLEAAQRQIQRSIRPSVVTKLIKSVILYRIFPYPGRLRFVFRLLRIYQRSGLQKLVRVTRLLKIVSAKMYRSELFLPEITAIPEASEQKTVSKSPEKEKIKAGFLRGCIMDYFYQRTNEATIRVLERCGCEIVIPEEQHCCGAVHLHNGDRETAQQFARKTIDAFLRRDVAIVVTNAAGCGALMKEYGSLLADDAAYAEKAARFCAMVQDISEFLADKIERLSFDAVPKSVVYDDPCHLVHAQKISQEPRRLLRAVPGLTLLPLNEAEMCCGSAGTFNIAQPELSLDILRRKMENIGRSGAEAVVTGNVGCMIQLQRGIAMTGMNIEVFHTIDIIDQSLKNGME